MKTRTNILGLTFSYCLALVAFGLAPSIALGQAAAPLEAEASVATVTEQTSLPEELLDAVDWWLHPVDDRSTLDDTSVDASGGRSVPPQGDYVYETADSFYYTYYASFSLTAGQSVTFQTGRGFPLPLILPDPVMYLFNAADPVTKGSWSDDNSAGGVYSKITCTPSYTGTYILLLYSKNFPGWVSLYKNGQLITLNAACAGRMVSCSSLSKSGELNYFTCKSSGNPRIWLIDNSSSIGLVRAYNDDYSGAGTYSWGSNARVKRSFSNQISSVLLSAYSSSTTGTCDIYMKCANGPYGPSQFPNLTLDDSIRSAPYSTTYNCIGWSGGLTSYAWPPDRASPWYNSNPLTAFDNFYSNQPQRYAGAWNYTRTGATSSNSVVDLWANSSGYQHASVNKPGNGQPHGYDWESKCGYASYRIFHPRNALAGSSYGSVSKYYRQLTAVDGAEPGMTLEESVAAGLSRIVQATLDKQEEASLARMTANIPEDLQKDFDARYALWSATWTKPEIVMQASLRGCTESKEYHDLLEACRAADDTLLPLVFDRYLGGDLPCAMLVEDLTLDRYADVLTKVVADANEKCYDADGVYIVPSFENNITDYIRELIRLTDN